MFRKRGVASASLAWRDICLSLGKLDISSLVAACLSLSSTKLDIYLDLIYALYRHISLLGKEGYIHFSIRYIGTVGHKYFT
jgi:hypothetical protein